MSVAWTLTHGATTQSLAAWGIENPVLQRYNLGVETLSFAIPTADIYADPVFAYDDAITLLRDGTVWFKGTVRDLPAAFSADRQRQRYVVCNAWQRLQTIIYQQRYTLTKSDFSGLIGSWSSRVVLGQDQWGKPRRADQVITDVSAYANKVGGGLATVASLPAWAVPPVETVRDISCAEAIRRMLAYVPDAVGWWDYTTTPPTLTIQRRADLDPVTLDLDDKDRLEVVEGLNPLNEAKPRGVVIVFVHTEEDGDGVPRLRETRQTAGSTTGPRVIFATVNLGVDEAVPTGLASQYYGALSTLQWAGTLRLHESACSGLLRPGKIVNLDNGRTAWATMDATVQSTSEELFTGVTTVEIGAADHLGLGEFVDMMRRWRERPPAGDFPQSQDNGTTGVDEQETGTDPSPDEEDLEGPSGEDPDADPAEPNPKAGLPSVYPTIELTYCKDGVPQTARVVGIDV
jgi:hypothetical protein